MNQDFTMSGWTFVEIPRLPCHGNHPLLGIAQIPTNQFKVLRVGSHQLLGNTEISTSERDCWSLTEVDEECVRRFTIMVLASVFFIARVASDTSISPILNVYHLTCWISDFPFAQFPIFSICMFSNIHFQLSDTIQCHPIPSFSMHVNDFEWFLNVF